MEIRPWKPRKVVIVGAGDVGATFAYALAQSGVADDIAMIDINQDLLTGQVLDLSHGLPYYPPIRIYAGDEKDYRDAHVIVITAGAGQKPGESRLDLLQRNAGIVKSIVDDIAKQDSPAIVLMVTNPVDVLTRVALQRSGWDRRRIIGSGTVLDSARFRYQISRYCGVGVHNVHAYILGEHGDSEFAAWSLTNVAGIPIDQYVTLDRPREEWMLKREEIERQVRDSAYHIIGYKGATNFGVGQALLHIVSAILRNQSSVLTVSVQLRGEYQLEDGVCLSVPCLVDENGVKQIISTGLDASEQEALKRSAAVLDASFRKLG